MFYGDKLDLKQTKNPKQTKENNYKNNNKN